MRTTVDIDDGLLERAKKLGIKQRRSVSAIVSEALASYLGARKEQAREAPFELLVRGKPGGRFPRAEQLDDLQTHEDLESLGLKR